MEPDVQFWHGKAQQWLGNGEVKPMTAYELNKPRLLLDGPDHRIQILG